MVRRRRRTQAMSKRLSKMEKQLTPLLKTFEQRFVDISPANSQAQSVDIGGWYYGMGTYAPTIDATVSSGAAGNVALPDNLRIGNKITVKSIHFRGNLEVAQSLPVIPTETDNQIRLLAVLFPDYDSSNTLTPAQIVKQVLQQYDGGATGSPLAPYTTMYSPYKARIDNINAQPMVKYKVLYDKKFDLFNNRQATNANGAYSKQNWRLDFNIKLKFKKGLVCTYDKPLSTEPSINNIVLMAVSDSAAPPHPAIRVVSRMKYMDA